MGAPRLGLGGTARQRHAVGTWGTGSRTCMLPTVVYRGSAHGSAQAARMAAHRQRAWQRTGSVHGSVLAACMRCTGSTHAVHRQREGGAQAAQGRAQTVGRQIQAGRAGYTDLANEGTQLGCNRSSLKDPQGRGWQRHHAPNTD